MEYPQGFFGSYHSQKPICGVLAVAIAAQVTYDVAHEACKRNLPKHRQRFGGRTYDCQRRISLAQLGCTVTDVDARGSLYNVIKELDPNKVYHIVYASHVVTVHNEFIIDQQQKTHFSAWPKVKSKRVKSVIEIKKGW